MSKLDVWGLKLTGIERVKREGDFMKNIEHFKLSLKALDSGNINLFKREVLQLKSIKMLYAVHRRCFYYSESSFTSTWLLGHIRRLKTQQSLITA